MFKHTPPGSEPASKAVVEATQNVKESVQNDAPTIPLAKDVSPAALRDLLEKNLKWSQIIYEQNRKINHKLFWSTFANWIRLLVIIVPLVLAIWLLPPLLSGLMGTYGNLLNPNSTGGKTSVEDFLKMLPLSPAQEAQLKTLINNK
jgi:hypothetical protein